MQHETDLTKALILAGWERAVDVQPKQGGASWPLMFRADWRVLIGDLGWAVCYRLDADGIQDMESARSGDVAAVLSLAKRAKP